MASPNTLGCSPAKREKKRAPWGSLLCKLCMKSFGSSSRIGTRRRTSPDVHRVSSDTHRAPSGTHRAPSGTHRVSSDTQSVFEHSTGPLRKPRASSSDEAQPRFSSEIRTRLSSESRTGTSGFHRSLRAPRDFRIPPNASGRSQGGPFPYGRALGLNRTTCNSLEDLGFPLTIASPRASSDAHRDPRSHRISSEIHEAIRSILAVSAAIASFRSPASFPGPCQTAHRLWRHGGHFEGDPRLPPICRC
jgi:hypothetical protein